MQHMKIGFENTFGGTVTGGNLPIDQIIFQIVCERTRKSIENHTIIIKAMRDLMTNYHANPTIVERFSLAFTEERGLEDTCREH